MHVRLTLEYEGTAYRGWQRQPVGPTLQEVLEKALETWLREKVRLVAAGRTDAGVHAEGQVACFHTRSRPDLDALATGLNALTPADVSIRGADEVPEGFDPRRDARSRLYEYRLLNQRWPRALWRHTAWHVRAPLDLEAMARAAACLVGEHDFSAFRAADRVARCAVRRVFRSEIEANDGIVRYRIEANSFVKHMVRNIVGTLVEVGRGRRSPESIVELMASRDRRRAGPAAPPHGLCLLAVRY